MFTAIIAYLYLTGLVVVLNKALEHFGRDTESRIISWAVSILWPLTILAFFLAELISVLRNR